MKNKRKYEEQNSETKKASLKTKIIMAVCAIVSFVLVAFISVFLVIKSYNYIKENSPVDTTTQVESVLDGQ